MIRPKDIGRWTLYSLTDWQYHGNKLGCDDLLDEDGNLVVTINVMDIAKDEVFEESYLVEGVPKKVFVLEADNRWSIYLKLKWLTPEIIQQALDEFGWLVDKRFTFEPYVLPQQLERRYRRRRERERREVEQAREKGELRDADEFLAELKQQDEKGEKKGRHSPKKVSDKRLAEIKIQKLKF